MNSLDKAEQLYETYRQDAICVCDEVIEALADNGVVSEFWNDVRDRLVRIIY